MLTHEECIVKFKETIKQYYYNNIVKYVKSQRRNNIQLYTINKIPVSNKLTVDQHNIDLPQNNPTTYYVFGFNLQDVSNLHHTTTGLTDKWIDLESLNNDYNINIDIYTSNGLMIPKRLCYYSAKDRSNVYIGYIAIDRLTVNSLDFKEHPVYLTIYQDTSIEKDRIVSSYIPFIDNDAKLNNIINNYNNHLNNHDLVNGVLFIDGYYYHQPDNSILNTEYLRDKEVEFIVDDNSSVEFTIGERRQYRSYLDNKYKDIIHIPKRFGNSRIRTINLAHIYAYSKTTKKGIKLPFVIDSTTYQLTHSDLGIPAEIIDNAITYLGDNDLSIYVKFVDYVHDFQCVEFSHNWLTLLHDSCTDEEILDIYTGQVYKLQNVFNAKMLEKLLYTDLVYGNIDIDTEEGFTKLIECLGYLDIRSIVGNNLFVYDVLMLHQVTYFVVPKHIFIEEGNNKYLADVYIDNKKVRYDQCTYTSTKDNCIIQIEPQGYSPTISDQVQIVPRLGELGYFYEYEPTDDINNFSITNKGIKNIESISLYEVTNIISEQLRDVTNNQLRYGYSKIENIDNYLRIEYSDIDDTTTFQFTVNAYDKKYIILPRYYNQYHTDYRYIRSTQTLPNDTIYIQPKIQTVNGSTIIPFLGYENIEVFANGYKLINGLDFKIHDYKSSIHPDLDLGTCVTIQNKDVVSFNGMNTFEILFKSYEELDEVNDFIIDNKFGINNENDLWIDDHSLTYINRKLYPNSVIKYDYQDEYSLNTRELSVTNVAPVSITTSISKRLHDIITEYISDDIGVIKLLLDYLISRNPKEPSEDNTWIEEYPTIYSSYLNTIWNDIINSDTLGNEYTYTKEQIESILEPYEHLKDHDVIFQNGFMKRLPVIHKFLETSPNYIKIDNHLNIDLTSITNIPSSKQLLMRAISDYILVTYQQ